MVAENRELPILLFGLPLLDLILNEFDVIKMHHERSIIDTRNNCIRFIYCNATTPPTVASGIASVTIKLSFSDLKRPAIRIKSNPRANTKFCPMV